jgi:hypothetical protein
VWGSSTVPLHSEGQTGGIIMPTLEEIKSYVYPKDVEKDDLWHELLPSYQVECVKWLVEQLQNKDKGE